MTTEDIRKRIAEIKDHIGDPETAHGLEDDLYYDVLEYISKGKSRIAELARETLKSDDIDFERWCA